MIFYVLQGITFGFAAAAQPGPLQAYIILQTLQHGMAADNCASRSFRCFSDLPIIVLVVFVLAALPDAGC